MAIVAHNVSIEIYDGAVRVASSLNADTLIDGWMVRVQGTVGTGLHLLTPDKAFTIKRQGNGGDWVNMYCEVGAQPAVGNMIVGGGIAMFRNRKNAGGRDDMLAPKFWKF